MPQITKPADLNLIWAETGDVLSPGTSKISEGWSVEIPPRQWFNYIDNKQDHALAHINQHGIGVWDAETEYQATKSYVQGSDGNIYRALNTTTNINPVGDGGVNWQPLFLTRLATALEAQGWTSNLTLMSPGRLADAFKGSNQSLTVNGFQKLPGGLIQQWGTASVDASGTVVNFPIAYPTQCLTVLAVDGARGNGDQAVSSDTYTTTGFTAEHNGVSTITVTFWSVGF